MKTGGESAGFAHFKRANRHVFFKINFFFAVPFIHAFLGSPDYQQAFLVAAAVKVRFIGIVAKLIFNPQYFWFNCFNINTCRFFLIENGSSKLSTMAPAEMKTAVVKRGFPEFIFDNILFQLIVFSLVENLNQVLLLYIFSLVFAYVLFLLNIFVFFKYLKQLWAL